MSKIQTAIRAANCVTQSTSEVSGVVYKGTKYTNGLVVVVDHNSCGYIFGKISLILISPTDVHFVAELYESVLLSDLGVHSLQKYDPKYVCVNADSLLDYYPLPVYKVAGLSVVWCHYITQCVLFNFRHRADTTRNQKSSPRIRCQQTSRCGQSSLFCGGCSEDTGSCASRGNRSSGLLIPYTVSKTTNGLQTKR